MKKKAYIATFIALAFFTGPIHSNTTRDIGNEPKLNWQKIGRWVSFYTNMERIKRNKTTLLYVPTLEKAARWQAEYCVKIKNLNHKSTVRGMKTVKDRISHFGGSYSAWGENLTVQFSINSEGVRYYIRQDSKGKYKDFGKYTIYWRDEQKMANAMVTSWMKSPGHRANILKAGFSLIGSAGAKGTFRGQKSWYGCQVFGSDRPFLRGSKIPEKDFTKIAVKRKPGNNTVYIISYKGQYGIGIADVSGKEKPVVHPVDKVGESYLFNKKFHPKGQLVVVMIDRKLDVIYPVMELK